MGAARAESWRQLRLHALEAVAAALAAVGRFGEAVAAAQAAVSADPLRESPHAALMSVHLSEGNQSEALREFGATAGTWTRRSGLRRPHGCVHCCHAEQRGHAAVTPAGDACRMAIAPVGLLVMRASVLDGSERPLRVEVRLTAGADPPWCPRPLL